MTRHLILVLGDQLDPHSTALSDADLQNDVVVMVEAVEESTHVWSHKARTALFLSAMRHHRDALRARGFSVDYHALTDARCTTLAEGLTQAIARHQPQRIIGVVPGDLRVTAALDTAASVQGHRIEWRHDSHFYITPSDFAAWHKTSKSSQLRMEFFYRMMRKKFNVLMEGPEPIGGEWNYDTDNRGAFDKAGPGLLPPPVQFAPDEVTLGVFTDVERFFPQHPGELKHFAWPVTPAEAVTALEDFVTHRLPLFGQYQDAMWTHTPFAYHSLLSAALNLKLISPQKAVHAAEQAYFDKKIPLAAAEGFIRQILGWREFVRGVYFLDMPSLKTSNYFEHQRALPQWYWTGKTNMACMRAVIAQTLEHGYAHHIQRLMVTGMFGVTAELSPQALCDWYLAVYVDAVEWVELPNTAGMALYANGGRFTSKPYIAGGAYIKRMSNYCKGCKYKPEARTGNDACPLTTLYWNFVDRHETMIARHPRLAMAAKSLQKFPPAERDAIRTRAQEMLRVLDDL